MKILNLIQCLNLGGMEQSSYILMEGTQSRGIDWQVQSVTPAGVGREIISSHKIPISDNLYEGIFGYKSYCSLNSKISKFSGDIILVTGPTLISCLSVRSHSAKKILSIHFCHGSGFKDMLKWKAFYEFIKYDYQAIIFASSYILEEARKIAPQLQDKFYLIENSIKRCSAVTANERVNARKMLDIPDDSFVIGNAGWLIARKRFDIFLEVCARLSSPHPHLLFLIAGDGSLRGELEEFATKLGINDKVKWIGWQKDLNPFYQSLDLLLFNSDSDALGRTILEALGYGIPVVASILEGGADSILLHQANGYLIREHNIDLLTKYCLDLIENPLITNQFRYNSIEKITKQYTTDIFIQKYMNVFNQVLEIS